MYTVYGDGELLWSDGGQLWAWAYANVFRKRKGIALVQIYRNGELVVSLDGKHG